MITRKGLAISKKGSKVRAGKSSARVEGTGEGHPFQIINYTVVFKLEFSVDLPGAK